MKITLRSTLVGLTALAIAGGVAALGAGSAYAEGPTSPQVPYSPDPSAFGGLRLYDAAGNAVTSGSIDDAPFATYAVADGTGTHAGDSKATLYIYTPVEGQTPAQWTGNNQLSGSGAYPNPSVPASIAGPNATAVITAEDIPLRFALEDIPNVSTSYAGLYELRMLTNFPAVVDATNYYAADILVTGSTWTLVNPTPPAATATTTTLAASPASGADATTPVTLSATVSPAATGTIQFQDGGVDLGAVQTIAAGETATITTTIPAGNRSLSAVFTPASSAAFSGSTGTLSYTVAGAPAAATTTALSANPQTGGAAYTPVALTATVAPAAAAGNVVFKEGAATLGTVPVAGGEAVLNYANLAEGAHSVTATFMPSDTAAFQASVSDAIVITMDPATGPTPDPSTVQVTVRPGALTISTPYTPESPLVLPDMVLNANGTMLSASAAFGDSTVANGYIQITDTRAGNLPWTASALAGAFDDGSGHSINAQNLGLTDLQYVLTPGNALTAANVSVYDNPAAGPAVQPADAGSLGLGGAVSHKFADAANGNGTIGFTGTMTLNAPTSTVAGTYVSTVVFTIG